MFRVEHEGDFSKTFDFLERAESRPYLNTLHRMADEGIQALANATPIDTGETAASWRCIITITPESITMTWVNDVLAGTAPLAVLLQYGHATRQGGYVQGRDYINPAMRPTFDRIADEAWRELTK